MECTTSPRIQCDHRATDAGATRTCVSATGAGSSPRLALVFCSDPGQRPARLCREQRKWSGENSGAFLRTFSALVPEDCCSPGLPSIAVLDLRCFLLQFPLSFQRILIYLSAVLRSLRKMQGMWSVCHEQGSKCLPMTRLVPMH